MIDYKTIKDYLDTQNLSVSTTDIQTTLAQLNAIFTVEKAQLLDALGMGALGETEVYRLDSGWVDLGKVACHLHPQVSQNFLFLQFFALLDSINEEQKNTSLSLHIALRKNTIEAQSATQKENLALCMRTHYPSDNIPEIDIFTQVNPIVKQVGLTGWGHLIDDAKNWQKSIPESQNSLASGSHFIFPIYTLEETLLGVLHAHHHEKDFFTPERQAPLIGLILFFSEKLKEIHWQMVQ